MALDDLLALQGLEAVIDMVDMINIAVLKGLTYIGLIALAIYLIGYQWIWQAIFGGYWIRGLWILGVWLFLELANLFGGGHRLSRRY